LNSDNLPATSFSGSEDADIIAQAVSLLLEQRDEEACAALRMLSKADNVPPYVPAVIAVVEKAREPVQKPKFEPLSNLIRASTYWRDGWRCAYCGRKLVIQGILELLTTLCPGFLGLLRGQHMPYARTEPAVERVYPCVDHVNPLALGGVCLDPSNHVAACIPCNARKNNYLGWTPRPRECDSWDGLSTAYEALVNRVNDDLSPTRKKYHRDWLRNLRLARDAVKSEEQP
jgi:hypothetical protein